MGCDGGTIPTRDELVRLKKKPEKKDKDAERQVKWQCCALSQEKLREPVVACQLGRMYNKESILELLIDRTKFEGAEAAVNHIKSLKDVRELELSANPAYREAAENGDGYVDRAVAPYCCPVAGDVMNGKHRFSFIWSCGCVMSEKALKEIPSPTCHKCGKEYTGSDVIAINPEELEVPALIEKMLARKQLLKDAKKAKKAAKHKIAEPATNGAGAAGEGGSGGKKARSDKPEAGKASKGVSKAGGLTHGVVLEKSKYKTVQDDPKASKTFKDLFTTSDKAKKQPQNHWVTFNPQYFR